MANRSSRRKPHLSFQMNGKDIDIHMDERFGRLAVRVVLSILAVILLFVLLVILRGQPEMQETGLHLIELIIELLLVLYKPRGS